jgi:hypothetical protein
MDEAEKPRRPPRMRRNDAMYKDFLLNISGSIFT